MPLKKITRRRRGQKPSSKHSARPGPAVTDISVGIIEDTPYSSTNPTNRKGIGGRKPVVVANPFIFRYEAEGADVHNILWDDTHELQNRLLDMFTGLVRAFHADKPAGTREIVSAASLIPIYKALNVITRQSVQDYMRCSESQAKRYIRVIKLCNQFIVRDTEYIRERRLAEGDHEETDNESDLPSWV
jgi:hypothetical protein